MTETTNERREAYARIINPAAFGYNANPDSLALKMIRKDAFAKADAILARQTGEQDQGSSGGLGQPGSGSRDEADVVATAALAMEFEQSLRGEANPGDELYGIWEAIGRDARLNAARQKLSAHEITLIVGHARATAPLSPSPMEDWIEEAIRLAEIGEYLYDHQSFSAGNGYDEPREFSINWEWQQSKPGEYGQGVLLAEAAKRHDDLVADGLPTVASKLRAALRATASTTPDTGTEKVATVIEGDKSRDAPNSPSQTGEPEPVAWELEPYDTGLLGNYGGGNVEWWQDYLRSELATAHEFYQAQVIANRQDEPSTPKPARVEITEEMVERAALALQQVRYVRLKKLWDTKGSSLLADEPSGMRDDARAALIAALNPAGRTALSAEGEKP